MSADHGLRAAVGDLATIDLAGLLAAADLQTRVDRKYLVRTATAADLVAVMHQSLAVLDIDGARSSRYESVYFDTPSLDCYLAAAHGRRRRVKIRTRSYLDSGSSMLELKRVSARGETIKERIEYPLSGRHSAHNGRKFLLGNGLPAALVDRLEFALITDYRRTTLLTADGARATLDLGLTCTAPDGSRCAVDDLVVVETKSAGPPTAVDRALWARGHRPEPISKYCTGLAAVRPSIPANRWNRTLRRHFDWVRADADPPGR